MISRRLAEIVAALPLRTGMRVLEIGCGPGVAARAVLPRIGTGHVLAIDRSGNAIAKAVAASSQQLATGRLEFRLAAVEDFELSKGERRYDLAFAVRVGALDGRHPEQGRAALARIRKALMPGGRLFIDGGDPLKEIELGDESIAGLKGLGPKSQEMLARAGITSVDELRQLGAIAAYARARASNPGASLNLLWALEAALTGQAWQKVARQDRTSLLLALEAYESEVS
ncbi:TfoX/Sxy family DNA transformation protein [Pseudoduganella sp. S-14]|jgi:SAM-dependent methyltransferase|uniref:TfoX/Sxy family DNA transformation protein n=1 Tax=Pseudoduganella sp. S-14 TaxID=3404065 RepID=UPI003CEF62CF